MFSDVFRISLTYCGLHHGILLLVFLFRIAWQPLLALLFSNSLLIMIMTRSLLIEHPGIIERVVKQFVPMSTTDLCLLADHVYHVVPLLLTLRWSRFLDTISAVVPLIMFIAYMLVFPVSWAYRAERDQRILKAVLAAVPLYLASVLLLMSMNRPIEIGWFMLALFVCVIAVLSDDVHNPVKKEYKA